MGMDEENDKKTVRNYKDSLFVDLFGRCKDAKANFLSLYNAITNSELKLENTEIEPLMLEQTIYSGRYNDVSMLINNKLIILVEQQSTINENMPLRFLEYITKLYEKLIPSRNRYFRKKIELPRPEFYVIYNGTEDYPTEKILKLSDSFYTYNLKDGNDEVFPIELFVKVFNISKRQDTQLLLKCIPLAGYARLVELVLKKQKENCLQPVDEAVKQCISEGILVDYFNYNSTEVRNMLIAEYSYEDDIEARQYEAREDEKIKTAKRMLAKEKFSNEEISEITGLSLEQLEKIIKELKEN